MIREVGAVIMKRESDIKYNHKSKQVFDSQWIQFFGVEDVVCMEAWNMLRINPFADEEVRQAEPKHMLWGLMWLKGYDTESKMCSHAGCKDKGTFRKWSKIFVRRLAWLIHDVVSVVHCTNSQSNTLLLIRLFFFSIGYMGESEERGQRTGLSNDCGWY
jgi:hypothetical protein